MKAMKAMMRGAEPGTVVDRLRGLRAELAELAFVLDRRGCCAAADEATAIAGRVGELCEELGDGRAEAGG